MHSKHIPGCAEDSECPNPDLHQHDECCIWAMEYNDDFREECEETGEYVISPNDNPLCCCGGPSIKHDESTKFKLICDEEYKNYKIWKSKPSGKIIELTNYKFDFPRINYYGRKKERY